MKQALFLFFICTNLWAQSALEFKDDKISPSLLRSTYAHLNTEDFNLKLSGSLESSLLFFRSFVNTYYTEMSQQKKSSLKGTCFGDAHPENFGFILFGDKTRFVFNDLDDSGQCSLEFDLLRYFVAASLAFNDQQLSDLLLNHLLEVFENEGKRVAIDPGLIPSLSKKNKKILEKYTTQTTFKALPELLSLSPQEKQTLGREVMKDPLFERVTILDAVKVKRETGGSGGLDRYWLLIKDANTALDILELKELVSPGLSYLQPQPVQTPGQRIQMLKQDLWGETPRFYHPIKIQNTDYLVRSRTKDDVNLEKLTKRELQQYLKAQVSLLALHHGKNKNIEVIKMGQWLKRSIPLLHQRFETTYQYLLKQKK